MSTHGDLAIYHDPKVVYSRYSLHSCASDMNGAIWDLVLTACWWAPEHFGLSVIKLQPVTSHPACHIIHTYKHAVLQANNISRAAFTVCLQIVCIRMWCQMAASDQLSATYCPQYLVITQLAYTLAVNWKKPPTMLAIFQCRYALLYTISGWVSTATVLKSLYIITHTMILLSNSFHLFNFICSNYHLHWESLLDDNVS